jgi:hypothetical protein
VVVNSQINHSNDIIWYLEGVTNNLNKVSYVFVCFFANQLKNKCELAYNLQPFQTLISFGIMNGGRHWLKFGLG